MADRKKSGKFEKGHKKLKGRKKGTPNKIPLVLKDAINEALVGKGGIKYLMTLKDSDFVGLLRSIVPREVIAEVRGSDALMERILAARKRA